MQEERRDDNGAVRPVVERCNRPDGARRVGKDKRRVMVVELSVSECQIL